MATVAKVLGIRTGPSGAQLSAQANAQKTAVAAQAEQSASIAKQTADTNAVLAGQQKVANGGAGFLSFLDDDMKKLFGG